MINYNHNLIKSVLLLSLAVSGNFVGNTLGCKTQYHLTNNMIIKHIVLLAIIYFTISHTSSSVPNPTDIFKTTLTIWISYILFTKQNITFTMITGILVITGYVLNSYIEYYETLQETNKEYTNLISKLKLYRKYSYNAVAIGLGIGFTTYFITKKNEYGNNFDFVKFIFGKPNCDSLL